MNDRDRGTRLSAGNRIYLYALLRSALGIGRQTFATGVDEALAADGLSSRALGFAGTKELLEELDDFIRLTVFKGGRIYATVLEMPAWDEALTAREHAHRRTNTSTKTSRRPWKRTCSGRDLKPIRPRSPMRSAAIDGSEAPSGPADAIRPTSSRTEADAGAADHSIAHGGSGVEATSTSESTPIEAQPAAPTATPQPKLAAELCAGSSSATIRLNVRCGPGGQEPGSPISTRRTHPPAKSMSAHASEASGLPSPAALREYPRDFTRDVHVPSALLAELCRLLPLGTDAVDLLSEDFRVARGAGALRGTRGQVTFPLRYALDGDDGPVLVASLRRRTGSKGGWALAAVAIDGRPDDAIDELLPTEIGSADRGPWCDLLASAISPMDASAVGAGCENPFRALARLIYLGNLDDLCRELADAAMPEPWNAPGCGDDADRFAVLRDVLALGVARIRAQTGLAVSADGRRAALDTGLLTPELEPLHLMLAATDDDIAWRVDAVATALDGRMPRPAPASFDLPLLAEGPDGDGAIDLSALPATRRLSVSATGLAAAIGRARAWARRDPRIVTHIYDVRRDRVLPLLPLGLPEAGLRCAVALEAPDPSCSQGRRGGLIARAVLDCGRAYPLARVISSEQPSWLTGRR